MSRGEDYEYLLVQTCYASQTSLAHSCTRMRPAVSKLTLLLRGRRQGTGALLAS